MNRDRKRAEKFREINRTRLPNALGGMPVACGKICYNSVAKAKNALKKTEGSGKPKKVGFLGHYWCEKCSAFHIGHSRY